VKANLLLTPPLISEKATLLPKSNSSFLERTNYTPPPPPNRAVAFDKRARKFSAMKNGKKHVPVFILRIQRAKTECRQVSFYLVNAKKGKLGKQCDANKFGFIVEPQDALDVLKLVGEQAEADNVKLARWGGNLSSYA